jgi:hypothetical protein
MSWNVPDDWNTYWDVCSHCGQRFHLSEGNCDCVSREDEQALLDCIADLKSATITRLEREEPHTATGYGGVDDVKDAFEHGERLWRIYVRYSNGTKNEIVLTDKSFASVAAALEPAKLNDSKKGA